MLLLKHPELNFLAAQQTSPMLQPTQIPSNKTDKMSVQQSWLIPTAQIIHYKKPEDEGEDGEAEEGEKIEEADGEEEVEAEEAREEEAEEDVEGIQNSQTNFIQSENTFRTHAEKSDEPPYTEGYSCWMEDTDTPKSVEPSGDASIHHLWPTWS